MPETLSEPRSEHLVGNDICLAGVQPFVELGGLVVCSIAVAPVERSVLANVPSVEVPSTMLLATAIGIALTSPFAVELVPLATALASASAVERAATTSGLASFVPPVVRQMGTSVTASANPSADQNMTRLPPASAATSNVRLSTAPQHCWTDSQRRPKYL